MAFRRILYDVESNGLLPEHVEWPFCMDRIHSLGIRCLDTGRKRSYVHDDLMPLSDEDVEALALLGHTNIEPLSVGMKVLAEAEYRTGHNIVDFDENALLIADPEFKSDAIINDTLVMARMVFADIKENDFRMAAKGQLPGAMIGLQGLEAWGYRLGLNKGDYKKERENELKEKHKEAGLEPPTPEELHHYVWGTWNVAMHDYMMLDIDVNFLLWEKINNFNWSPEAIVMEHQVHALMVQQERNGFVFNVTQAEALADVLRTEYDSLSAQAVEHIGKWYRPAKRVLDAFNIDNGEHGERRTWGEVTFPKRTVNFKNELSFAPGEWSKIRASTTEGAGYVKIELKEFNPNSRPQIVDRLQTLYGWEPQDFTEKGAARVDDDILRELADKVPLAETLAEVFFMKKRLGQVADGKNGWLKLVKADGRIHGRVNVGGTVTGRATHAAPNVSQVPGVNAIEFKDFDKGELFVKEHTGLLNHVGLPILVDAKWKEKKGEWAIQVRGREAGFGWDCRELFTVEPGYKLVGCDLSGIEFRCLGNLTEPFDGGEIIDVVLNGDIHQKNADLAGISRSIAKRLLYAAMYGGGDAKLGSIVEPFSSEARQRTLGKQLRAKLMAAMPSLDKAIKAIKREKRQNHGTIRGLDGRRLYVRSDHAALNLRLQSDGALIAKKWCLLVDDLFYEEGWDHGNGLEYSFCSWSHDEIQVAVREDLAERAAELMVAAAPMAGDYFNFKCPVAAEAKIGSNWAETH
ncbi:DNA polymerase [Roseobacter phage DSS3P8]|nr:DNA polymerase [Roseobacter phage DSS3P8]